MAFCQKCGAYIPDGVAFCSACGASVQNSSTRSTPPEQPPQPQPQPEPQYQQQYYQPQYQQPYTRAGGGFRANIRKRDLAMTIILSIVTCGIYGLVWFFGMVEDLNTAAPDPDDKTAGTVLLLSIVTCGIYGWIWLYKAGDKVDRIRQMNGELPSNSGLIYLLCALFGLSIVSYALIQSELNKVAMDA
jgi:hypothetical protein